MGKNFILKFYNNEDYENHIHRIWNVTKDDNIGNFIFSASNLNECPEDATLTRDLFTGYDYIKTLELGMKLALEGYTCIDVVPADKEDNS